MTEQRPQELDAATAAKVAETVRRTAAVESTTVVARLAAELESTLADDTELAGPGGELAGYGCAGADMEEFLALPECPTCGGSGKQLPDGFWCRPTEFTGRQSQGDGADG